MFVFLIEGEIVASLYSNRVTLQDVNRIGHSPEKEIIDIKINKAKQYLRETTLPVHIISRHVGFNPPEYFTKAFKKAVGLTPIQYRKKYQVDS